MGSVIYAAARDVTERKRTQEELARTGTYYRALIEKAPDGVALLNGEGMLCYASPAARRIFGYSDDTEGPLDPDAATHPDDLSRVQETVAAVVRDPTRVATIEYRFRGKDGAWRWIESTFSNQLAEPGLEAIIINFHDVTERKKAEEALVAMETRFRTIMDSMQNADELHERAALQQLIMTMATELIDVPLAEVDDRINRMLREVGAFQDFDRVFVFRNDLERGISTNTHEWCSAGITPEIDNLQAIPLDDLSPVMAAHRKGEAYSVPRVADLPEGESVRALMEAQGIKSTLLLPLMHDGVNIGFVGFDAVREERGVTETAVELLRVMAKMIAGTESRREAEIAQNEAEQLIRENEERFRSLLDGIEAVPVQAFGPDGTVHYWNLASQHLYGYTSAEAIGRNIIDLVIPPDLRDTIKQRIAEMAASRKPIPVTEDWLVGYDGRRSLVRTNHAVVQLPGREVEIFSIDQDVTEQRQAEEEIRRLVREKETLLKEVQHRIKNTMNTMVSLLSLQADALGDSKAASALHDAENRFRSMEVLYDQLYRTDTHDSGSTREYLNPLVHRIVEVFPNSETVHITTEIEDIVLDAKRLSGVGMIVNELITNAMKYAFSDGRQGGLSVYLNAGESEITLIVTDNGPGIPETRKQASFGTTMVQALADELRGTIRFEHDGGTRVILGFPR
jgi:PAS domain S-box-containing protein